MNSIVEYVCFECNISFIPQQSRRKKDVQYQCEKCKNSTKRIIIKHNISFSI